MRVFSQTYCTKISVASCRSIYKIMRPLCYFRCWGVGCGRSLLLRKKKKFEWYSWCVTKYDLFTSSLPFSPPVLQYPITDLLFYIPRCILEVL